ncbi:predicted protein [Nematostella vectensis]|uniref:Retrotransposon gag domain-containing protein n=1 Tax=Nematostella vectensis TaxID=45351 RepID=A7S4Y6_NEMVE|nr:predicted protein [Nematostella vectensis]|eukprot:XP_001633297.1 predicted protein [Nematostella vectensis]
MAELTGLTSPRMDWNATDLQQALKKFKATVELYFSGPLKSKSEEEKVSYLLIWTGEEGIELVSTWSLTSDEKKKLSTYWKKFEEYVAPKSNFRLARFKLRTLKQKDDEPVDSFIKKVRLLASECRSHDNKMHIYFDQFSVDNVGHMTKKMHIYFDQFSVERKMVVDSTWLIKDRHESYFKAHH